MIYQTTLTQKGQITIPKILRDALQLGVHRKVRLSLSPDRSKVFIEPTEDFLELAKKVSIKKNIDLMQAREQFEQNYERF